MLRGELAHCQALNLEVQALLRGWSASRPLASVDNPAAMLDQAELPWFAELNRSLLDRLGDVAFRERIRFSTRQMHSLAAEIAHRTEARADRAALRRVLVDDATFAGCDTDPTAMIFGEAPEAPMLFPRAT